MGSSLLATGLLVSAASAAPEVPPAPPAPPLVTAYGIFKPEFVMANGVETFGKISFAAPTAAAHPVADPLHDEWADSFQLQQSRFGLKVGEGTDLQGRLEIDFVDFGFNQSSPIQAAHPRLRLAYVSYTASPGHKLTLGQQWDIFSPLNPATTNMVGASFMAGNSAFIRPQFIYTYGTGEGIEISAALGMQRQNAGAAMNTVEYGLLPSVALQAGYRMGKTWFGASVIATSAQTVPPPNEDSRMAFGANLFASLALTDMLSLGVEGYVAKNGGDLGLLTLSNTSATATEELTDAGGFVSATLKFSDMISLWVLGGVAMVLNSDDVPLGYTRDATGLATRSGISGIERNVNLRATLLATPTKGLDFYLEPFMFLTKHKVGTITVTTPTGMMDVMDEASLSDQTAFGTALGARMTF
jgi:hypothetical protein